MNQLTKISNHFQVEYQKFKDTGAQYWNVTIMGDPPQKGKGPTLEEAIADMHRQNDIEIFKGKLNHALRGTFNVEDLKDKIRAIL